MSDYYDDSFESESDSDSGEKEEADHGEASNSVQNPSFTTRDIHLAPSLLTNPRLSAALRGSGSGSDLEEHEFSRFRPTSKSERSPKVSRMKFRVKKPNIGNFTQKIKNKLKRDSAVFGATLEVAVQRSTIATDQLELPTVFRQCIDFLEEHGINHQGIYRLPGVKSRVEELKSHFDKGEVVDLSGQDPNTVASLLKLYLRELPDPLIPHSRLSGRVDTISDLPSDKQVEVLHEILDNIPTTNRLLLSWLLQHMLHIIDKSSVNKMTLPNMVIVFSPTLQLPAHFLHVLYQHVHTLFGDVELTRYVKPEIKKSASKSLDLANVDQLETEHEVNSELGRLSTLLMKAHSKVAGKFYSKEEDMWVLQRTITQLRRKKKAIQKVTKDIEKEGEEEFMKTLLLMEATLKAENEELLQRKAELQSAIKHEAELIDEYKVELRKYPSRSRRVPTPDSNGESGDEAELAKKIATLKWHGKEMELRNKNLVQSIIEEDEAILNLRVKLKVLPLSKELHVEED